jgi:tetratricopeptide (TPR) repeat protein/transcriptional regulator with XRE-family HTH domain
MDLVVKERGNGVPNQRLSDERTRRRWSQAYVAKQIDTHAFMVHRWEHGQTFPGPRYRQKLLQLFKKSAEELGLVPPRDTDSDERDTPRGTLAGLPRYATPDSAGLTEPLYDPLIPSSLIGPAGLVGREDLLQKLKERLYTGEHVALSAINGLPGVGKTALAVELVHDREVRAHFRDGVLWAGLGPVPNVAGLLGRWGALLGVTPEHANIEGWQKAITAAIGERRMLLVIDDAWKIEDALAFRVGGPHCAHLVTTRFPVIAHRFAQGETIEVHELDEDNGLRLLERLAPEAVRSEPEEARALVRSMGGLPLALNLIGKYLYIQAYSGQPRRLQMALQGLRSADQRLHLTQPQAPVFTSPGHAPDAPLSLQSVISVSDQQLGEAARLALRALSIFPAKPNTFSMEAALAVCYTPLETIATLIEAGLLEQSDADRYTLHQTIADYARLHHTGSAAEERMAAYYVSLVEAHELDYSVLEQETDNVLAALQAAFELGMQAMLLRGANAFSHFLQTRGLFDIAEAQLKRAEQVARSGNDTAGLTTTLLNLGRLAERRGDFITAQASYLEGLLVARQSGNSESLCDNLTYLGGIAVRRGELKQAAEYSQEALVLSEQSGYHRHSVALLGNLGSAAFFQGNYADAQAYWQKALALARQQNHPERMSALLENLGAIAVNHGDYEQGKALYHEALALARQIGQGERISSIYINLSEIALRQKDYAQVKEYSQEGLTIARQIGQVEIISLQLISLGEVEIGLENYEQAEDYLEEAFELAQQVGLPWLICYALLAWGKLYFGQQRLDLAATTFKGTIEIARDANKEQVGFALYYLAQVTFAQGNAEEARQQGQESLDIFNELGHEKAKEVEEWLRREKT